MTNKNKNRHTTIETKKSKSDVMSEIKTPEPTMADAIKTMSADGSYMVRLSNFIKIGQTVSLSDISKPMVLNKPLCDRAKKTPTRYHRFGLGDLCHMSDRVLFWLINNKTNAPRFELKNKQTTDANKLKITRLK